jgi:hypothetical protein
MACYMLLIPPNIQNTFRLEEEHEWLRDFRFGQCIEEGKYQPIIAELSNIFYSNKINQSYVWPLYKLQIYI